MPRLAYRILAAALIPCFLLQPTLAESLRDEFETQAISARLKSAEHPEWTQSPTLAGELRSFQHDIHSDQAMGSLTRMFKANRDLYLFLAAVRRHLHNLIVSAKGAHVDPQFVLRLQEIHTALGELCGPLDSWLQATGQVLDEAQAGTPVQPASVNQLFAEGAEFPDHVRSGLTVLWLSIEGHAHILKAYGRSPSSPYAHSQLLMTDIHHCLTTLSNEQLAFVPIQMETAPEPETPPAAVDDEALPDLVEDPPPAKPVDWIALERLAGLGPELQIILQRVLGEFSQFQREQAPPLTFSALAMTAMRSDIQSALQNLQEWQRNLGDILGLIKLPTDTPSAESIQALGQSASEWLKETQDFLDRIEPLFAEHESPDDAESQKERRLLVLHHLRLLIARESLSLSNIDFTAWIRRRMNGLPVMVTGDSTMMLARLDESVVYRTLLPLIREMQSAGAATMVLNVSAESNGDVLLRLEPQIRDRRTGSLWSDRIRDLAFAHISHDLHQIHGTFHLEKGANGIAFLVRWPATQPEENKTGRTVRSTSAEGIKTFLVDFGLEIARRRKLRNWSIAELARQAHLDKDSIGSVEQGKQAPRLVTVIKLARALDVAVDILLDPDWAALGRNDAFTEPISRTILANRLLVAAQDQEMALSKSARDHHLSYDAFNRLVDRLQRDGNPEVDSLFVAVTTLGLTMHEATGARPGQEERAPAKGYRALRSATDVSKEGFSQRYRTLLNVHYPRVSLVVERVLARRPQPLKDIMAELARELNQNADALKNGWSFGIAILREPSILDWLEKAVTMPERLKSFGLSPDELSERSGVPIDRILNPMELTLEMMEDLSIAIPTNVTWLVTEEGNPKPLNREEGSFNSRYLELPDASKNLPAYRALRRYRTVIKTYGEGMTPSWMPALAVAWARATVIGRLAAGEIDSDAENRLKIRLARAG